MTNAKRLLALCVGVAVVLGIAAGSATPGNTRALAPVQVGVDLPLSGPLTQLGLDTKRGIELGGIIARKTVLNGRVISFDYQDNAFEKERSVVNFQRFMSNDVVAVIGPLGSLIAGAALPIAQQAKIPALSPSAPDNGLTKIGDYVFATLPALVSSVPPAWLASFDKAKIRYTRPAIFVMSSYDVGRNETDRLVQLLARKKIKPVLRAEFGQTDTDFSAQVALVNNAKPNLIIVSGALPAAALLIKQLRNAGVTAPIAGDVTTALPSFRDQAGSAAEGVMGMVFWYPDNPTQTAASKAFTAAYRARYKSEPTQYSAIGYDSVLALAHAIKQAKSTDPTKIRNALARLRPFQGAIGPKLSFTGDRAITGEPGAVKWKSGTLVALLSK